MEGYTSGATKGDTKRNDTVCREAQSNKQNENSLGAGQGGSAMPEMLTTEEAAEMLRCRPRTVRAMVRRGELSGTRPSTRILVPLASVRELIRVRTLKAGKAGE